MRLKGEKLADLRVKHLEMVQAVVARMASQGAAAKAACITIVTAVAGFGVTLQKPIVALLALFPITMFALLDAQLLRLERHFRREFDRIRKGKWSGKPDFEISPTGLEGGYWVAFFSWSIFWFYASIALAAVAAWYIARLHYGGQT